jgi:hypothetical protein
MEDLGFLGYMGILAQLRFFFWDLEMTYPPIFKGFKQDGAKKIS